MTKGALIFEGNEKQVFATDHPDQVIFRYKDVTVAYNNVKRARFKGKGALDNQISAILLDYLNRNGVETHFIEVLGDQEQLCRKIEIIPLQGYRHSNVIVALRYNNDDLEDPFINRDHAVALGLATYQELDCMYNVARRVNDLLKPLFHKAGIELVDMKIEFGRASDTGAIIISDEISPDTCRLWDEATGERLDKDRFRLDLSRVVESYNIVLTRLKQVTETE